MELPPYPDAGDPCANTTPYILAAICANGVRVLVWVLASEVINTAVSTGVVGRVGGECGGGCAKADAIKLAREKGWTADELVKVLKAL